MLRDKCLEGTALPAVVFSAKTLDSAITHLEQVLSSAVATLVLPKNYWRSRIEAALATPGLTLGQKHRLERLKRVGS
jgi:hypothetical protein